MASAAKTPDPARGLSSEPAPRPSTSQPCSPKRRTIPGATAVSPSLPPLHILIAAAGGLLVVISSGILWRLRRGKKSRTTTVSKDGEGVPLTTDWTHVSRCIAPPVQSTRRRPQRRSTETALTYSSSRMAQQHPGLAHVQQPHAWCNSMRRMQAQHLSILWVPVTASHFGHARSAGFASSMGHAEAILCAQDPCMSKFSAHRTPCMQPRFSLPLTMCLSSHAVPAILLGPAREFPMQPCPMRSQIFTVHA